MSEPMVVLYIFVLACFIGYWVIWGVTPSLHTPLISLTNAISGIIVVGAILVGGFVELGAGVELLRFLARLLPPLPTAIPGIIVVGAILVGGFVELGAGVELLGFVAVLLASINIFGGFLVTQRMLAMFK